MKTSMTKLNLAIVATAVLALGACTTLTREEQSVATGAAIGAVAGAALSGDNSQGRGAVLGGTIGAVAGGLAAQQ